MTVGQRIKMRREALGLSQQELAEKVGYASRSSINKIELSRDLPLKKVEKMAIALDTTPSFLMGWTKNPSVDYNPRAVDNVYTDIPGDDTPEPVSIIEKTAPFLKTPEEEERLRNILSSCSLDVIEKSISMYQKFEKLPPASHAAVDVLLQSAQSEP